MQAPPIDRRTHADIVAWTEQLASCERVRPGPALASAVLVRDLADPANPSKVLAEAGTLVDRKLAEELGTRAWLDVAPLVVGSVLPADVENPANRRVHPAGTVVDAALARVVADLARVVGPEVLLGLTLARDPRRPFDEPGAPTVVDAELVEAIDRLAWARIRTWRPRSDGGPDPGRALIQVFGRFAELIVERVNRAAEKHELAFLNLIGTQPLPPQPAGVPLTFALAAGSPVDAVVPAGTQAAAAPAEGEEDEVVFETESSLTISRAQLLAVHVGDTEADTHSDRTGEATGALDRAFPAFSGDEPVPHELYLACDEVFTEPGTKDVALVFRSGDAATYANWPPISWAHWDGEAWRPTSSADVPPSGLAAALAAGDPTVDEPWRVLLRGVPQLLRRTVDGREAGWLRGRLGVALPPARSGLVPESVAVGNRPPQDLTLPLAPFGDAAPARWFYMSADEAVGTARALVRFRVELARPGAGAGVQLEWTYRVGSEWRPLGRSSATSPALDRGELSFQDTTQAFTRDGVISFYVPPAWPREVHRTRLGRWLRVEVTDDGGGYTTLPQMSLLEVGYGGEAPRVDGIGVSLESTPQPEPRPPAAGAFDTSPLDLTKDFFPFGEEPRFNDTLYLAVPDALARPRANLTLDVVLTNPPARAATAGTAGPKPVLTTGNPTVAWEAWDGQAWQALAVADGTRAFRASGAVATTLPATLGTTQVNGVDGHWLRARLTGGHYGVAATYTQDRDAHGNTVFVPEPATFAPPIVASVRFTAPVSLPWWASPSACLTYDDFAFTDRTAAAAGQAGSFPLFRTTAEREPALYLAFDRAIAPRPASLYLQVEPPAPEDVAADQLADLDPATGAQLVWEYSGADGWRPLGAPDQTAGLSRSGGVSFVGPADHTPRSCFGRTAHWLRLRWVRGAFPVEPRLRRVLLNTTWAVQATTVDGEVLGSGNGRAAQVFTTAQAPVQPGQQVVVREPEPPPDAERVAHEAVEGADAVEVVRDAAGRAEEIWVRWHEVPDLYASGPRDRHYTLDRLTGEVRFGDGRRGLVPPPGQSNVRITYRTGGGEQGNRAAGTIVQLKSSIPYVDGVVNHEPSQGGSPREPLDRLKERGPRALRHRDRAVTAQDLEDLAYAASAAVARATVVGPAFDPGKVELRSVAAVAGTRGDVQAGRMGVVVVADSTADRPTPSLALLGQVREHLLARCSPTAELWVAGPEWVQVTVTATVAAASVEAASAVGGRVRLALEGFLHPLTGGLQGDGWAFGRKPHRSDLFALVEALDGVDHVVSLTVAHDPETQDPSRKLALQALLDRPVTRAGQPAAPELRRWLERSLVCSGPHEITVTLAR